MWQAGDGSLDVRAGGVTVTQAAAEKAHCTRCAHLYNLNIGDVIFDHFFCRFLTAPLCAAEQQQQQRRSSSRSSTPPHHPCTTSTGRMWQR